MTRDKKELVSKVKSKLETKKIYILGIGKKAIDFASLHMSEIDIAGFLTDQRTYDSEINVNNQMVDVIHLDNFDLTEDVFLIIATYNKECSDVQFVSRGYSAFNNYIWAEWYDVFMKDKKVVLFAGNCQIDLVYYFVKAIKKVNEKYVLMVYHSHLYKSRYAVLRWNYYLTMCDYYITNNYMIMSPTTHNFNELPMSCRIIKAPRVFFDIFWPEVQNDGISTCNDLQFKDKNHIKKQPHGPFDVGDRYVNELIKSGLSDDEIVDKIISYKEYDCAEIEKRLKLFFEDLENQEMNCDLNYSNYLKENIMGKRCFYDPIHMNTEMNWYVADQIVSILGFSKITDEDIVDYDEFGMYLNHCTELPVYPTIAKMAGLEWAKDNTGYNVTFYGETRKMSFENYYRAYLKVARLSMNLLESM